MPATPSLRRAAAFAAAVLLAAVPTAARAADGEDDPLPKNTGKPFHYVAPASDEAEQAMKQFALPPGWKVDLFAAEPRVANPVCLTIDDRGRVYVVETFRRRNAVLDIRKIGSWLDEDLANRTVEDRIAMVKRRLPNDWQKLEGITDRIRLIEDSDGDGRADKDTVFADRFDTLAEGTAAGVLPVGDSVWFTNIPHLWKLTDADGDGVAESARASRTGSACATTTPATTSTASAWARTAASTSRSPTAASTSSGRQGDRQRPDEGAVLRCEPDGSNLEIVHRGLRNPQELAFDELGTCSRPTTTPTPATPPGGSTWSTAGTAGGTSAGSGSAARSPAGRGTARGCGRSSRRRRCSTACRRSPTRRSPARPG
jgi:quinoprotein glucose dehydrogenase